MHPALTDCLLEMYLHFDSLIGDFSQKPCGHFYQAAFESGLQIGVSEEGLQPDLQRSATVDILIVFLQSLSSALLEV